MSYGTGRTRPGAAYPPPAYSASLSSEVSGSMNNTAFTIGDSGYNSSAYYSKSSESSVTNKNQTPNFPSSTKFTYSTGNPYGNSSSQSGYPGPGPLSATKFSSSSGIRYDNSGRGRGSWHGRGRGVKRPQSTVVKPKAPPPMTSDERLKLDNHNMKQLVAPKPPHRILSEMAGGGIRFEYTENPPLPPGMIMEDVPALHTLITEVDGDISTGTGPTHEIAKNICSEHAIMGVVSRRYHNMNEMVAKGVKTKDELMLEDETPFELASIAIFKMLNEWEAAGYELPPEIEEVLYAQQMFVPAKQRLSWIRGSNLGYSTALQGVNLSNRKRPMKMPTESCTEQKHPVAFLNEIRGTVDYQLLGTRGTGPNIIFMMGVNIDGVSYSGTGPSKKDAKKDCAKQILAQLYRINSY